MCSPIQPLIPKCHGDSRRASIRRWTWKSERAPGPSCGSNPRFMFLLCFVRSTVSRRKSMWKRSQLPLRRQSAPTHSPVNWLLHRLPKADWTSSQVPRKRTSDLDHRATSATSPGRGPGRSVQRFGGTPRASSFGRPCFGSMWTSAASRRVRRTKGARCPTWQQARPGTSVAYDAFCARPDLRVGRDMLRELVRVGEQVRQMPSRRIGA